MNSKRKGKVGEREAAKLLRDAWALDGARRGVQYQGTPESPDVLALSGVHVEVKRRRKIAAEHFLRQAESECSDGDVPVVLMRQDRGAWLLMVRAERFPELARRYFEEKS